nr:phosphoribosylanthranilate isomerase [Anoxybacillus caldiproteolyticus]
MNCFRRWTVLSVLLKYCGNRSAADLQKSANSGAHYLGLIFAESKRKVEAHEVKKWLETVSLNGKQLVGVFVNASVEDICKVVRTVPLSVIQCHGSETVEQVVKIKEATNLVVWKAIHHQEDALEKMKQYASFVDGYVVDSRVSSTWGGTGISFDWRHIPFYLEEAERQAVPCLIAGGVNPDNIEELLCYRPHGIDISSGIEKNGEKCTRKMKQIEEKVNRYVQCSE